MITFRRFVFSGYYNEYVIISTYYELVQKKEERGKNDRTEHSREM